MDHRLSLYRIFFHPYDILSNRPVTYGLSVPAEETFKPLADK